MLKHHFLPVTAPHRSPWWFPWPAVSWPGLLLGLPGPSGSGIIHPHPCPGCILRHIPSAHWAGPHSAWLWVTCLKCLPHCPLVTQRFLYPLCSWFALLRCFVPSYSGPCWHPGAGLHISSDNMLLEGRYPGIWLVLVIKTCGFLHDVSPSGG